MKSHDFSTLAAERGIRLIVPPIPGTICRYPTVRRPHRRDGAVLVREDGSGWIQLHGVDTAPVAFGASNWIDHADVAAIRRAREIEQRRQHEAAAARAVELWASARPADPAHGYIVRKGLAGIHGARQIGDALVLAYAVLGEIRTLQFIRPDGSKQFLRGGQKRDCYAAIGGRPIDRLVICEGWATGCSVHEATALPIAVAGDAGNIRPVAEALHRQYPALRLIVAADHDANGVGEAGASAAARATGARVVMPLGIGDDWNDVAYRDGLSAVTAQFAEVWP